MYLSEATLRAPARELFDRLVLLHPAVLIMACLPLQWIELTRLGGFDIVLPYLAILFALAAIAISDAKLARGTALVRDATPFLLPYVFYLLIIMVALYGSLAQSTPVRQIFFILSGLAFGTVLIASQNLGRLLRAAGVAAPVVFVIITEVIARDLGTSWVEALTRFFTSGDLGFVTYSFFRGIFNAQFDTDELVIAAAEKNSVAVALLVAMQLFAAGRVPGEKDRSGFAMLLVFFVLLLMLNARSVLLVAIVSVLLAALISALRARRISLLGAFAMTFAAIGGVATLAVVATSDSAIVSTLKERFAFSDHSTDARLGQYSWAISRINESLLLGGGYAELHGQPVHNLFLGAFMHAGLFAFLLVVGAYLALVALWIWFCARLVVHPDQWSLPIRAEWVAALPLLPLFRVWVAGGAGHPALGEWIALMTFGALLALDRWTRRRRHKS
ncbi:O-antigen ligase family protein [Jannaschia formosa]|uniref:O-antigen ligase family protein n=1 Tax=Jannaschia formosa TaxID=2259592 RepID=UPI000E1B82B0|nr:O-antigen ligase family protein [Jannaschia formosa]TFL16375.1 O-antigen ligase domain-containing protein [Jannaschia formosa]